jgi:metallo-beta-lactamase family protein
MFQGVGVEQRNLEEFEFNPSELDFVILTHSHIDHSGLIPKLFRHGFNGTVYLTPPTAAISRILLLDSAKIQEKEQFNNQDGVVKEMIYSTQDALNAIESFVSINFFENVKLSADSNFFLIPAGHILGAASVCLEVEGKRLIFSGDLGRREQSIIKNYFQYEIPDFDPDYVISESLYGNSIHENRQKTAREFVNIVNETVQRNGNVIIPSFALHRTQELIELLKFAFMVKEIKNNVQIIIDSPMAISITEIYTQFCEMFNDEYVLDNLQVAFNDHKLEDKYLYRFVGQNSSRLKFDNLRFNRKGRKSLTLLNQSGNVIVAGSGMANGGRIVHHLYNGLGFKKNSIIFVGYQAEETLGRQIVDGAKSVFINDKDINVNAQVYYLRGFSGHADQNDLYDWLTSHTAKNLKKVFLIHSEPKVAIDYGDLLKSKGYSIEIPTLKQEYIL